MKRNAAEYNRVRTFRKMGICNILAKYPVLIAISAKEGDMESLAIGEEKKREPVTHLKHLT